MANRRMLSKSICTSEQVNSLPIEAELLFTWMITAADDDGRLKGSAASVRGNVFPMKDFKVNQIEEMLKSIQKAGLMWRWSDDNGTYIEFPKWLVHQKIRRDRYTPSELPSYKDYVNQTDTNGKPSGIHLDTQDSLVENNQIQSSEIEKKDKERESEGEPILDPNAYIPNTWSERVAKAAWLTFKDKPEVFESRYLALVKAGVSGMKIVTLTNEIKNNTSIQDKGMEFERRMKNYLPKNKTSIQQK